MTKFGGTGPVAPVGGTEASSGQDGRGGDVAMVRRSRSWIWAGRGICVALVAGMIVYLIAAGLDKADKVASGVAAVLALLALAAPYLLPPPQADPADGRVRPAGAGSVQIG